MWDQTASLDRHVSLDVAESVREIRCVYDLDAGLVIACKWRHGPRTAGRYSFLGIVEPDSDVILDRIRYWVRLFASGNGPVGPSSDSAIFTPLHAREINEGAQDQTREHPAG